MCNRSIIKAIIILFTLIICSCSTSKTTKTPQELTFAFGSCVHQWDDQPIWNEIVKNKPDVWIWLGDIIYTDTEDMAKMKNDYDYQKANVDYNSLKDKAKIIGIWDDHDYGLNNGGKEYPKKDSSRLLLFDFLDYVPDSSMNEQKGAYQKHTFIRGDLTVNVYLLDVRYFRDSPENPQGTILGREQWNWLIDELANTTADVNIIGGGIQFLPTEHRFEKWANFTIERTRLLQIIDIYNVPNPILISGDRHLAEMSLAPLPQSEKPILEITSSGLTHSYRGFTEEANQYRIGPVVPEINFGLLTITKNSNGVQFNAEIRNKVNKVQHTVYNNELKELLDSRSETTEIRDK